MWKLGSRDKALLWKDKWLGDYTLKQKYPKLYLIYEDKGKLVKQMSNSSDLGWCWNLVWRRNLFRMKTNEDKGKLVKQMTNSSDLGWCWNLVWRRNLFRMGAKTTFSFIVRTEQYQA